MTTNTLEKNCSCAIKIITDELKNLLTWCDPNININECEDLKQFNKLCLDLDYDQTKYGRIIDTVNNFLNITTPLQENHYTIVQSLLAEVSTSSENAGTINKTYLPFGELNAQNIHPQKDVQENKIALREAIINAVKKIHNSHYKNLSLMVDHLDSLFTIIAHGVTLSNHRNISLCDLLKSKVALATALYAGDNEKLLIIQGDFYGIQDYIFTEGRKANKGAAKLLRGRSFMVSLYTELVALKVLEACNLPATAQVMNAAGKFMIVAPNIDSIEQSIKEVKTEVAKWFWNNTYAVNGFGIVTKEAKLEELATGDKFTEFVKALFANLEEEKAHKFADFLNNPVHQVDYTNGVCKYNSYLPASSKEIDGKDDTGISELSQQQLAIGECLVKYDRILITKANAEISDVVNETKVVIKDFLGMSVTFTQKKELTGFFSANVRNNEILRFWDYSLPSEGGNLWNGFARRYINGYVAQISNNTITEQATTDKYTSIDLSERVDENVDYDDKHNKKIKPWNYLACDDKRPDEKDNNKFIGQRALAVLKGDVDNLGSIFQQGIADNNFANMISLSRQINNFFAVYLPYLCQYGIEDVGKKICKYENVYTVFAGGDDFFLVGSWKTIMELASTMAEEFKKYVGGNSEVHFSSGILLFNDGTPIKTLANMAEHNLEQAKSSGKNAVHVFSSSCQWNEYSELLDKSQQISDFKSVLSVGYIYGMFDLCEMAENVNTKPKNSIWHSYFTYRTHRLYGVNEEHKREKVTDNLSLLFGDNIKKYGNKFKVSLMHYLYQQRI